MRAENQCFSHVGNIQENFLFNALNGHSFHRFRHGHGIRDFYRELVQYGDGQDMDL